MADSTPGTIILVNGSPSSGKTSIARAVQRTFDEPYLHLGADLLWMEMLPWEWAGAPAGICREVPIDDGPQPKIAMCLEPFGKFAVSGLNQAIAALAEMGHNIVVDGICYEASLLTEILTIWRSLPVWLVGVYCPLETILERAALRADRGSSYAPMATWIFDEVHRHTRGVYDLEVDTSQLTPTACALEIKRVVDERGSPSAFKRLEALLAGSSSQAQGEQKPR
jgi:chloramphenicol 3-O phosphotransferase